jgi:hypothetical protein
VPGAQGFVGAFPLTLHADLPAAEVLGLRTPLAAGNVSSFADRWALIESDTLPVFLRLVDEHPGEVRDEVRRPLAERVDRWRLAYRLPSLVWRGLTGWRLRVERAQPTEAAAAAAVDEEPAPVTIDLSSEESAAESARAGAAAPAGVVLATSAAEGAPLVIRLPGGASPEFGARLAAFGPGTSPDDLSRLVVKLPSVEEAELAARCAEICGELGIGPHAPLPGAVEMRDANEAYRALVVARGTLADWCDVEVQVEHHLDEERAVIDLLFAWRVEA